MKTIIPSSVKDIKKMFASEHVKVVGSLFGTKYYNPKSGKKISKTKAMQFLSGEY